MTNAENARQPDDGAGAEIARSAENVKRRSGSRQATTGIRASKMRRATRKPRSRAPAKRGAVAPETSRFRRRV